MADPRPPRSRCSTACAATSHASSETNLPEEPGQRWAPPARRKRRRGDPPGAEPVGPLSRGGPRQYAGAGSWPPEARRPSRPSILDALCVCARRHPASVRSAAGRHEMNWLLLAHRMVQTGMAPVLAIIHLRSGSTPVGLRQAADG
jgi:hypothetical protein